MRSAIHVRSFTLGVLVVLLALLAMGQAIVDEPLEPGRSTIVTGPSDPHAGPVAYVLDTTTGQVWARSRPLLTYYDPNEFYEAKVDLLPPGVTR
jgi:hypothetical protein